MSEKPMLFVAGVGQYSKMRYPTAGDWTIDPDHALVIVVADTGDWRYNLLIALHETVEAALCHHRGISEAAVTAFDKGHELQRRIAAEGMPADPYVSAEPGDHPAAPYRREHFFATSIERLMAAELGVDWAEYEAAIEAL